MLAEVIFRTYYYLHNSRIHTDVITNVRRMAKHKSVLRKNTFKTLLKSVLPKQKVFWQNRKCFQSVGAIFRKDTNFFKNEIGFSNIGDFKKIWNRAKTIFLVHVQYCPPPFYPQSSVFLCSSVMCSAVMFAERGARMRSAR